MKHTGGPAFPAEWHNDSDMDNAAPDGAVVPAGAFHPIPGMTLRDYFAAAVAGHIWIEMDEGMDSGSCAVAVAQKAYIVADAMLKERQK